MRPLDIPGGAEGPVLVVRQSPGYGTNRVELSTLYPDGEVAVRTVIEIASTDIGVEHTSTRAGLHRSPQVFAPGRVGVKVGAAVMRAG